MSPRKFALSLTVPTTFWDTWRPVGVVSLIVSPSVSLWSSANLVSTIVCPGWRFVSVAGEPLTQSILMPRWAVRGSRPRTWTLPAVPVAFPRLFRHAETTATPGSFATSRPAAGGIGENPSPFCSRKSPRKFWSIVLLMPALSPAANTATKVTSARPIIKAAAVTAVRPGLRIVFSRAS